MALPLPPTYLLSTHLSLDVLHDLEDKIPTLTYDITEAKLVLGKITTKQRALFELRNRKLWTEDVLPVDIKFDKAGIGSSARADASPRKRRKADDTEAVRVSEVDLRTESEAETDSLPGSPVLRPSHESTESQDRSSPLSTGSFVSAVTTIEPQPDIDWDGDTIKVVKLDWFTESLAAGRLLHLGNYLVYEGRPIPPPRTASAEPKIIKVQLRPYHVMIEHIRLANIVM